MGYIDEMKGAMRAYRIQVTDAEERVASIRKDYGEDAAKREWARQQNALEKARSEAGQAIRAAHNAGTTEAKRWATLKGSDLTDDTKLLDAGLVNPEQFDAMKDKYKGNYTMLAALRKYADARNDEHMKKAHEAGRFEIGGPYQTHDMPTPESKIAAWDKLRDSALSMLDMIDGGGNMWERALHQATGFSDIEHFGQGADV